MDRPGLPGPGMARLIGWVRALRGGGVHGARSAVAQSALAPSAGIKCPEVQGPEARRAETHASEVAQESSEGSSGETQGHVQAETDPDAQGEGAETARARCMISTW